MVIESHKSLLPRERYRRACKRRMSLFQALVLLIICERLFLLYRFMREEEGDSGKDREAFHKERQCGPISY